MHYNHHYKVTRWFVMKFDWDSVKEQLNLEKHGVSFTVAKQAFYDEQRLIAKDVEHSVIEDRYYCIGRVETGGILTVRFTFREDVIRIFGAGYWRKGKKAYEKHEKNKK